MTAILDTRPVLFALEIRVADDSSPRRARNWLAWVLKGAAVQQDTVDAVLLVCSELVTNAVVHTDSARILVSAELVESGVRLTVHDDAPVREWREQGGELDERGRGLLIVDALAEQLHVASHAHGTTVTAVIPYTGPAA